MNGPAQPPDPLRGTFRRQVCEWLEDNAPEALRGTATSPFQGHWGGRNAAFASDDHRRWFEAMLAQGWTAPRWPKAYGGGGLSSQEGRILSEELERLCLPLPLVGFGLTMIGPIILECGTEAQKAQHLSGIARGEIRWCQGYSEPGAGSDLASLQTRAVWDGDAFVVHGQKVWTSHADQADWIFLLARTNTEVPKQQGISFLLADMRSPGITVRPIALISGASPFCETFLDGLRVGPGQVVGQVDGGWTVAKSLLNHERVVVGKAMAAGGSRPAVLQRFTLRDLALRYQEKDESGQVCDPILRHQIVQQEMDQRALELTIERVNDRMDAGDAPGPESSIIKVAGTELNMRRWDLAVRILHQKGLGWEGEAYTEEERAITRTWLRSRGNAIEGGTSEIQRNIIATRVLGLPRGKRK